MFFAANISTLAVEKYDCNIFSECDEVYSDVSDSGAFAFGYSGKTIYIQSFVPFVGTVDFTADGGFVGVPFLDNDTVCAVYMTENFNYRIVRINCLNGQVSYVNSDILDDFNINNISLCNGRLFVLKTDEPYCYASAYDFSGNFICDYKFAEKNINEITTNNGGAYAVLYDGSVYRLNENDSQFCIKIKDSSDFYNCGANFLADSNNYIYSLKENKQYNNMYNTNLPFAVDNDNFYYAKGGDLYCGSFAGNEIKSLKIQNYAEKLLIACNKTIMICDNYSSFFIISNNDYNSTSSGDSDNSNADNSVKGRISDNQNYDYIFTDDNILCNVSVGTTADQLKVTCPEKLLRLPIKTATPTAES